MDNNTIREFHHDDNCFWGYVGAFLGNVFLLFLGVLIWNYTKREDMFSFLVFFAPLFAFEGYKFFKGIVNKNTIKVIFIISLITYVSAIYYIIPKYIINDMRFYSNRYRSSNAVSIIPCWNWNCFFKN